MESSKKLALLLSSIFLVHSGLVITREGKGQQTQQGQQSQLSQQHYYKNQQQTNKNRRVPSNQQKSQSLKLPEQVTDFIENIRSYLTNPNVTKNDTEEMSKKYSALNNFFKEYLVVESDKQN